MTKPILLEKNPLLYMQKGYVYLKVSPLKVHECNNLIKFEKEITKMGAKHFYSKSVHQL